MKKIAIVVFCMLGSVYVAHASEFDSVTKAKANNPIPHYGFSSKVPPCPDYADAYARYKSDLVNNKGQESSQRELSKSQEMKRCP